MRRAIILILGFLLLFSYKSSATHMAASDIHYVYLGNNQYKFIVTAYRDCRGVPMSAPAPQLFCGSTSYNITMTRTAINDITPTCDTFSVTPCTPQNVRTSKGVEEHIWEATIDFGIAPYNNFKKNNCCEVIFKISQCCRNGSITTGQANQNFYSECMLNICDIDTVHGNSSPELFNDPMIFACCNQPYRSNVGARDTIDYDSISYELVSPLSGKGQAIAYTTPLSKDIPMTPFCPGTPGKVNCVPKPNLKIPIGFFIDTSNGDLVFTPTKCDEVGVFVVQVNEYRKDSSGIMKRIGFIRRDIQVWVENCAANNPPEIGGPYSYSVKEGDSISFEMKGTDVTFIPPPPGIASPDTLDMFWNHGINGADFRLKDSTAREKTGVFAWRPPVGSANTFPYVFTVEAIDDNCPIKARSIRAFRVYVNSCTKRDSSSLTICSGDSALLHNVYRQVTGYYSDTTTLSNGCDSISTIHLTVVSVPQTLFSFNISNKTVTLDATNVDTNYQFKWRLGNGDSTSGKSSTYTYTNDSTYNICLETIDTSSGCFESVCDSVGIGDCNALYGFIKDTTQKFGILIIDSSSGSNLNYFWEFGDGDTSTLKKPSHVYANSGKYNLCLTVSNTNCTSTFCDSVGMDSTGKIIRSPGFTINVIGITEIEEYGPLAFSIIPNPAERLIRVVSGELKNAQWELINNTGQKVMSGNLTEQYIDLKDLSPGIYYLKIKADELVGMRKLMIQQP